MINIIYIVCLFFILAGCAAKKELITPVTKDIERPEEVKGTYYWSMKPQVNIRESNSIYSKKIDILADGEAGDCCLWFQEDQNGEIYDFERCPD